VVGAAGEEDELGVRRAMRPPAWNSRLKASVLDLAMIVLSRSKKAAVGRVMPPS
jgi:hypothetical protein